MVSNVTWQTVRTEETMPLRVLESGESLMITVDNAASRYRLVRCQDGSAQTI